MARRDIAEIVKAANAATYEELFNGGIPTGAARSIISGRPYDAQTVVVSRWATPMRLERLGKIGAHGMARTKRTRES
jgi:hypothetical protein